VVAVSLDCLIQVHPAGSRALSRGRANSKGKDSTPSRNRSNEPTAANRSPSPGAEERLCQNLSFKMREVRQIIRTLAPETTDEQLGNLTKMFLALASTRISADPADADADANPADADADPADADAEADSADAEAVTSAASVVSDVSLNP
jgi:hypothetical protein